MKHPGINFPQQQSSIPDCNSIVVSDLVTCPGKQHPFGGPSKVVGMATASKMIATSVAVIGRDRRCIDGCGCAAFDLSMPSCVQSSSEHVYSISLLP